ncbi:MAG TPA: tetratricopeptide repeat protein [Capsulimonadaceae bacterium]|jgi:multisubunit Na+/H+ antiporter MnhG subunit
MKPLTDNDDSDVLAAAVARVAPAQYARWVLGALLVAVTLIVYIPAMNGGFILDDDLLLTANPLIKSNSGWWQVWWTTQTPDYLPVMSDSFWLEWRLWGMNASGYHVSNIVQHAISTVLLWLLLRRIGVPGAWLAALLFAVHPVNVRSVAWISERKNTLSMVFYLLTLHAFVKGDDSKDKRWQIGAVSLFALALLSKSSTVVLPAVLLILVWYRRRTITRADLLAFLPFAVLALGACVTTIWFQNTKEIGPAHVVADPFIWRVASSGMAVWFYIWKLICPANLAMIYPRWTIDTHNVLSFVPTLLVIVAAGVVFRVRKGVAGGAFAAVTYYLLTLLPVLGFVNMAFFKSSMVSDHLQYIPMIGMAALAGAGFDRLYRIPAHAACSGATVGAMVLVLAFAITTWQQGTLYASRETLAADTLRVNPTSHWAHGELAMAAYARHDLAGAEREIIKVLELDPTSIAAYNNLGSIYMQQARYADAVNVFVNGEKLAPDSFPIHMNLAMAYSRLGMTVEAIAEAQKAVTIAPGDERATDLLTRLRENRTRNP